HFEYPDVVLLIGMRTHAAHRFYMAHGYRLSCPQSRLHHREHAIDCLHIACPEITRKHNIEKIPSARAVREETTWCRECRPVKLQRTHELGFEHGLALPTLVIPLVYRPIGMTPARLEFRPG